MERSWERAHSFVELTQAELERSVGAAFPDVAVLRAERVSGGLRNSNYRLTLSGEPSAVLLRLYVADRQACAREAGALAAVAGRVPAPRVWHPEPSADPPFALLEWLEGEPLDGVLRDCDGDTAVSLAAACGAALAAIHAIRFPAPGFLGPDLRVLRSMPAWAPTVLSTVGGPAGERLGSELSARVRRAVELNAQLVEPVWSEAVLVHGDFKPWNLLGRIETDRAGGIGRWRLTGILDWEFACAGSRLLDFATFLRGEASLPADYGDAFAGAYLAAGGTIPADWRRLTRLIDVLNLLQLLEWVDDAAAAELRALVAANI